MINNTLELNDRDAGQLATNLAKIMQLADDLASNGSSTGFEIYKRARDSLEIMSVDQASRQMMARLRDDVRTFQGYRVTDTVLGYMREGKKIFAIKQFREETELGLKESKDWVEAYMQAHGM